MFSFFSQMVPCSAGELKSNSVVLLKQTGLKMSSVAVTAMPGSQPKKCGVALECRPSALNGLSLAVRRTFIERWHWIVVFLFL